MPEPTPPPRSVLEAFGAQDEAAPQRLGGGRGTSWRVDGIVLKPVDDAAGAAWTAKMIDRTHGQGLRLARPVRASTGDWLAEGWAAAHWVEGEHAPRWTEVIAVGDAFHAAVAGVSRPAFLDHRDDPWARGDAAAWAGSALDGFAHHADLLTTLASARRPVMLPSQLIHGDLTENVLFADPLPPAVIDLAPYWRPAGFASAIVVGDALLWLDPQPDVAAIATRVEALGQLLVRALIYRLVTDAVVRTEEAPKVEPDRYQAAVELACDLANA